MNISRFEFNIKLCDLKKSKNEKVYSNVSEMIMPMAMFSGLKSRTILSKQWFWSDFIETNDLSKNLIIFNKGKLWRNFVQCYQFLHSSRTHGAHRWSYNRIKSLRRCFRVRMNRPLRRISPPSWWSTGRRWRSRRRWSTWLRGRRRLGQWLRLKCSAECSTRRQRTRKRS